MATNREKGEIGVEVDGQLYTLVLDINALVVLEEHFDAPFTEIIERMNKGSVKYVRAFVWAALQAHHPDMTLLDAGKFIQAAGGLVGFGEKLKQLAGAASPDSSDLRELDVKGVNGSHPQEAQAKPKRGTGERSTSTPVGSA